MTNTIQHDQLHSFIQRIENLEAEKQEKADDLSEVYSEAKGSGFDPKIMRTIIKMRKKGSDECSEEQAIQELYLSALGMLRGGE